jgi:hypothetical protein
VLAHLSDSTASNDEVAKKITKVNLNSTPVKNRVSSGMIGAVLKPFTPSASYSITPGYLDWVNSSGNVAHLQDKIIDGVNNGSKSIPSILTPKGSAGQIIPIGYRSVRPGVAQNGSFGKYIITSLSVKSPSDIEAELVSALIKVFAKEEESRLLLKIPSIPQSAPDGVHVFIDCSNVSSAL